MRWLAFWLTAVLAAAARGEEEITASVEESGAVLTRQEGRSEAAHSGGTIAFFRSARPRVSAVRTLEDTYIGGDRTPQLKALPRNANFDHDLHTAYRLPLQRLSDQQLAMLLRKYSPDTEDAENAEEMSRIDMINKVQEKMLQRNEHRLMRPTLLTNINVLPEDVTIDSEPAVNPEHNRRTTVGKPVTTTTPALEPEPEAHHQKQIPELEAEVSLVDNQPQEDAAPLTGVDRLRRITNTLRRVKARYDSMKLQFLRRLRELNERKIQLAVPTKIKALMSPPSATTTTEAFEEPTTAKPTTIKTPLIDNDPFDEALEATTTAPTTSRSEWEHSMIDRLRNLVRKTKKEQEQERVHVQPSIHTHETEEEIEETTASAIARIAPPRAQAIPTPKVQHGAKTISRSSESFEDAPTRQVSTTTEKSFLHFGGDEEEAWADTTSAPKEHSGGFKFAMKKVGEISTTDLIKELNKELLANPSAKEQTTTETPEEEETGSIISNTSGESKKIDSTDDELDEFAASDEEEICDAIACNFEKGDLCQWEPSQDELSPSSPHYMHRVARRPHYIRRTWHNWQGRYRNRITGIARAQVFSFENQRFAAAYVRPFQRATLSAKLLSNEKETIRFRAWEATRNVQLRMCCDTTENCIFETEVGVFRGNRRWREHTASCPKGTSKIIFECINHGIYQGACGLDNIHLLNLYCPQVIPLVSLHDNEERRRRKN